MKNKMLLLTFLGSFIFMLTADAAAQESRGNRKITKLPGAVSGEIAIKEASGMGTFKCSNLIVKANKLGGGWARSSRAYGDFSKRECRFVLPSVPAGESFVAVLTAQMPSCDQKSFNTTTSFPMTLKSGEALKYNFEVMKISCVLLK
jgi:hypothetical protein